MTSVRHIPPHHSQSPDVLSLIFPLALVFPLCDDVSYRSRSRGRPRRPPARIRVPPTRSVYGVVRAKHRLCFIGLQIRPFWRARTAARGRYFAVGLRPPDVIVVRFAWPCPSRPSSMAIPRLGFRPPRPMLRPSVGSGLIISWAGMRGIVTLAAALALPAGFPFRDLIVLTAFAVVLGTLSLQGLTLKPLLRALDLQDDDPVGRELSAARERALSPDCESEQDRITVAEEVGGVQTSGVPRVRTAIGDARPSAHATPLKLFRRRAGPFSPCVPTTRSATMPSIRSKNSWTGWRSPPAGDDPSYAAGSSYNSRISVSPSPATFRKSLTCWSTSSFERA